MYKKWNTRFFCISKSSSMCLYFPLSFLCTYLCLRYFFIAFPSTVFPCFTDKNYHFLTKINTIFLSGCLILLHITVTNVSIHIMYSNVIVYSCCICRYENIVSIMEAWKDIQNVGTWCNCIGVCQYCGSFLATNIS